MAAALISASQHVFLLLFIASVFSADQINITAVIGKNQILPCRADRAIKSVEWKRTDIEEKNVLRYRNDAVDPGDQHPSFKHRVFFQDIEMKDGDVSLVLINVTMNDAGTYEAGVVYDGTDREKKLICSIHLDVAPPPPPPESSPSWATALLVIGVLVITIILGLILIGFLFYYRRIPIPRWLLSESELLKIVEEASEYFKDPVEVEEGAESVLLPFKTSPEELGEVTVEWIDGRNREVHVYKTGSDQPGGQSIETRTKMNNDALKTGVFSLTLENPTMEDSGKYRCRVKKDNKLLGVKTVQLTVKAKIDSVQIQTEDNGTNSTNQTPLLAEKSEGAERRSQ